MRLATFLISAATTVALAGCGSSDGEQATPTTSSPSQASATQPDAAMAECTAADFTVTGARGKAPEVVVPDDCAAPTKLLIQDVAAGSGTAVTAGDTAEVHYHLAGFADGAKLDSSWDRGQSFPVENVGQARVIDGWNKGLLGMKEGARRLLVVPPALGYGAAQGHPLANETLVFVIDLVKVS